MSKINTVVKEGVAQGEFILSDLGGSYATAAKAVSEGYFSATKKVRKTGKRGRPARVFKATAKARKLV